jgi:hypothetical protein
VVQTEALLELLNLRRNRCRICRVAFEDFDGNRASIGRAQQAIDDL